MVRTTSTRWLLSAAVLFACARSGRAATLALDAPDGCVDAATLQQEVADLVGRPLADVPDADFHLTISRRPNGGWHSRLEAIEHRAGAPDAPHVRELEAQTCSELGDAAAVAIGVSIRAFAESKPRPAEDPRVVAAPAPTVTRELAPESPPPKPWRPALTLSVAGDGGDLPDTGVAVMGGAALQRRLVRLAATVGWLPSRDKFLSGGTGGHFGLAFGAADACVAPTWASWKFLGCLGGELGAYWATGFGVARPDSRTALWRAGRVSLGTAVALSGSVGLLVEGTAVVPWPRQTFVLDGTTSVYRPGVVGVRVGAGVEFSF